MYTHYQGKVRHAEFWLMQLINKFGTAQFAERTTRSRPRAEAWRSARELGVVDGRERRVVPQPRSGEGIAGQVGVRLAGRDQDMDDAIKARQAPAAPPS